MTKNRTPRWLIVVKGTLALTLVLSLLYVSLSLPLKPVITQRLQAVLGRRVTLEDARLNLFRGIVLNGLHVYEADGRNVFLSVPEAAFPLLVLPDLREPSLFLPSLTLYGAHLKVIRTGPRDWNFSDIAQRLIKKGRGPSTEIYLQTLSLQNGTIDLVDQRMRPEFTQTFSQTALSLSLSFRQGARFDLSARTPDQTGQFRLRGVVHLQTWDADLQASAKDLDLSRALPLLLPADAPIVRAARIHALSSDLRLRGGRMDIRGEGDAVMDMTWKDFVFKGRVAVQQGTLTRTPEQTRLTATLGTNDTLWTYAGLTLQGQIATQNTEFTWTKDRHLRILGALDLVNAYFQNTSGQKLQGSCFARGLAADITALQTTVRGNIVLEKPALFFNGIPRIIGRSLALADLDLSYSPSGTTLKSPITFRSADFKFSNAFRLTGDWQSGGVVMTWMRNQWHLQGDLLGADLKAENQDQQYLIAALTAPGTRMDWQDGQLSLSSLFKTRGLEILRPGHPSLSANPAIDLKLNYNPAADPAFSYESEIFFTKDTLRGLPLFDSLPIENGSLRVRPQALETDGLVVQAGDSRILLTGRVRGFSALQADLKAESDRLDIQWVTRFFKSELDRLALSPSGTAAVSLAYQGPLTTLDRSGLTLTAQLQNAEVKGKNLPSSFKDITGQILYAPDHLRWQDLRFSYMQQTYTSTGHWDNFTSPSVRARIESPQARLATDFQRRGDTWSLTACEGQYLHSPFDITGKILMNGPKSLLDIRGRVDLDLNDLAPLLTLAGQKPALPSLSGRLPLTVALKGPADTLAETTFRLTTQDGSAVLQGLSFDKIEGTLEQDTSRTRRLRLTAASYGGRVSLNGISQPLKPGTPFEISGDISGVDLSLWKADTSWRSKDLSGRFAAALKMNGQLSSPETFRGTGAFRIQDGLIWKFRLLSGIWRFLLIPELDEVPFTQARANVVIKNGRVVTDDLILQGQAMDLQGRGWIDFNRQLNLTVLPSFRESEILGSLSNKKAATRVVSSLAQHVGVKLTGPLNNPTHQKVLRADSLFKSAAHSLLEGAEGLMDELLNGF